jgi:flagellar protein FliO/FliZ
VGLRASPRLEPLPDEAPLFRPIEPPPRPQRDTLAALADELSIRPTPPAPPVPPRKPMEARQEIRQEARKPMTPPAPVIPAAAAPAETDTAADQSLADMAQRLEAALRKPETEAKPSSSAPAEPVRSTLPPPPRPSRPMEAKPAPRNEAAKPNPNQGKTEKTALYDSLEQEMASLLGRPTKT